MPRQFFLATALTFVLLGAGCSARSNVSLNPVPANTPAPLPTQPATPPAPADTSKKVMTDNPKRNLPKYHEIAGPSGYVNTNKITIGELIGRKVVLVDFLTYTCINCIRTFPYLNAWYDKYKDQGLEIVGIHTPEFAFEHKYENVVDAMKQYGIKFPVVLDNDYATWRAYGNSFWPRKYLIDIYGNIVYDHIGEGEYDETEHRIQEALKERMTALGEQGKVADDMAHPKEPDQLVAGAVGSPETYFGAARNEFLGNGTPGQSGEQTFTAPGEIKPNTLYLVGDWKINDEYAENRGRAKIIFKYKAMRLNFVASGDPAATVTVLRDGKPVGIVGGKDVKNGTAAIQAERLYELIDDPNSSGEHTLEIQIDKPGLKAFTFTFG